jgi:hypothetical protein
MSQSIFTDKAKKPDQRDLEEALSNTFPWWNEIRNFTVKQYPNAIEEWNCPGAKYGWSYRIKDKKRAIVYLLPRQNYFKVALVYGQKATDQAIGSNIAGEIKEIIKSAPVYAEGRGFRIDVTSKEVIKDIKELIDIKLAN